MNTTARFSIAGLVYAVVAPLAASSPADTNFSYTYMGIGVARTHFDDTVWIADEAYDEVAGLTISGASRLGRLPLVFFGSTRGQTNDGSRSELSLSKADIGLAFPFRMGDRVDLVPAIGYGLAEVEACYDDLCAKSDDSGALVGLGTRMWLMQGSLELNLDYEWIDFDHGSESAIGVGVAGWFLERHSVRLAGVVVDDARTIQLGYRFSW